MLQYTKGGGGRTKVRHIDARQQWPATLRDKNICFCEYVPSRTNLADFFTKPLASLDFHRLCDCMMIDFASPSTSHLCPARRRPDGRRRRRGGD